MVFITAHLAAAATTKLSDQSDRQWFLISLLPSIGYLVVALAVWLFANRRAIRDRQVSLRSIMLLIGVLSPGLALLKLVYWP